MEIYRRIREIDNQSGYFRIILYLDQEGPKHIRKISANLDMANRTAYKVLDLLQSQELIEVKEERGVTKHVRKNYYLTEKGKRIAKMLVELVEEIEGGE